MASLRFMQLTAAALVLLIAGVAQSADLRTAKQALVTDSQAQVLAQAQEAVSTGASSVKVPADFEPIYKTDDPYGVALMMLGVFLIPLSQVLIWKNEQRAVKFA